MIKYFKLVSVLAFICISNVNFGQQNLIIDQVVAIVGNKIIKQSDIENQFLEIKARGEDVDKCFLLEDMLRTKLMVNQAALDSVEVTDSQVESELNRRLDYFINQLGSVQKLEDNFKKSIVQIKEDLRQSIKEYLLTQKMEGTITGDIAITPTEIKNFYNKLSKDSIPLVNSKIELCQIGMYPPYTEKAVFDLKEKMLDLRKRIINGESFATLAVLYSEDGSATRGGEIGFAPKGGLDPEYAKAAFALKEKGDVSKIVESQFGFHIIQLIEKRGDMVNTRHILMKPKADPESVAKVKARLDSLRTLIVNDSIKFEKAAMYYSEDKNTRFNGGVVVNERYSGDTYFEMDQIDPADYYVVKNLKVGEVSEPYESTDDKGKKMFKIIMIKSRTNPHKANLKEDYNLLKEMAINDKRQAIIKNWIAEKQKTTYIHIDDSFKNCQFSFNGWIK